MIKIDEVFSIKNYGPGWELHETRSSDHEKSLTGIVTTVSYYGSLRLVTGAIIEKSCDGCADATALMMCIMATGERVATLLSKVPTT